MSASTFALTDVQRDFRETLRTFCEEKVAPHAAEVDRNAEFPWKSFEACKEMELPALGIPEAYGGAGADMVTQAIAVEELSRVCASTSLTILISKLGMLPVMNWGSEELKREYVPRVASGEIQASYCLSEADAGSDVASMRTRAVRDGDDYVLTGSKYWITNAGISDVYIVFAKTDPDAPGTRGVSAFIVERDTPGFTVGEAEHKLGIRGSSTPPLYFADCHIPKDALLGGEGNGFKIAMQTLDGGRIGIGAQALGIAQAALDASIAYAKERVQFGKPIANLQAIQWMIADMATEIDAARLLVYRAGSCIDHGLPYSTEGAMAKLFASETATRVAGKAIQIHGGYGYTESYPVERHWRDAKITEIYEGTSEVQRLVISRAALR